MNSDYYTCVSEILQKQYMDRYHQLPITEAWRQLWDQDEFILPPKAFNQK